MHGVWGGEDIAGITADSRGWFCEAGGMGFSGTEINKGCHMEDDSIQRASRE